jgi:aryl-alcohol dehydrogenase-like predicted oxidoreductase
MSVRKRLGRSDIEISGIGLGCWQFSAGKGIVGGYWPALAPDVVRDVVLDSLDRGVNWFDTAEIYGNGRSERALARALHELGRSNGDVIVATKWSPVGRRASSIGNTIGERLACLDGYSIDLHQVHNPMGFSTVEAEMDAMAELVRANKIRTVGVSNFNESRMRRAHAALAKQGLPLVSNQMRYSLLDRRIESNGVMAAAKTLGITIIAYSPLEQGLLTGRFHDDPTSLKQVSLPRRMQLRRAGLERSRPVVTLLREIARAHGVTAAQIALAWLLQFHGDTVVAIPGASSVRQAQSNADAMNVKLTQTELRQLDEASRRFV